MVLGTSALAWTYAAEIYGGLITSSTPSTITGGGGEGADGYLESYEGEYQGEHEGGGYQGEYAGGYRSQHKGGYAPHPYEPGYASNLRKKAKA